MGGWKGDRATIPAGTENGNSKAVSEITHRKNEKRWWWHRAVGVDGVVRFYLHLREKDDRLCSWSGYDM